MFVATMDSDGRSNGQGLYESCNTFVVLVHFRLCLVRSRRMQFIGAEKVTLCREK